MLTHWQRVEAIAGALIIALAVIGVALLPLTTPAYVQAMVSAVDSAELTGLGAGRTLEVAEQVRDFVTSRSASPLPATVDGRPGFDAAAVSHLVDVRDVLVPARTAALSLALLACAWAVLRMRSRTGKSVTAFALALAGRLLLAGAALAIVAGLLDFGGLFARFHAIFFAAGTWVFPPDALLIQVFPLPFWGVSGVMWGVTVVGCAGLMLVASRRIRFTERNNGV